MSFGIYILFFLKNLGLKFIFFKKKKNWEFNIPSNAGFYYLGTLKQDDQMSIIIEDSNKDECDKYVKTLNPDFDPKAAIVLKPKQILKSK